MFIWINFRKYYIKKSYIKKIRGLCHAHSCIGNCVDFTLSTSCRLINSFIVLAVVLIVSVFLLTFLIMQQSALSIRCLWSTILKKPIFISRFGSTIEILEKSKIVRKPDFWLFPVVVQTKPLYFKKTGVNQPLFEPFTTNNLKRIALGQKI